MTAQIIGDVAGLVLNAWIWPAMVLFMTHPRLVGSTLHRVVRWWCPLVLPAWMLVAATDPHPVMMAAVYLPYPILWPIVHRRYCKDRHGRRLRDAASGWVRRAGNRLTVVPARPS